MLEDTIEKIEARLKSAGTMPDATRAELIQLLQQLKTEIAPLSKTHEEKAQTIASYADISTYEATRARRDPESLQRSVKGLESSVTDFQASHPQLVAVVNRISQMLANMGI